MQFGRHSVCVWRKTYNYLISENNYFYYENYILSFSFMAHLFKYAPFRLWEPGFWQYSFIYFFFVSNRHSVRWFSHVYIIAKNRFFLHWWRCYHFTEFSRFFFFFFIFVRRTVLSWFHLFGSRDCSYVWNWTREGKRTKWKWHEIMILTNFTANFIQNDYIYHDIFSIYSVHGLVWLGWVANATITAPKNFD